MGKSRKKQKSKVEFTEDYRPIRKVAIERKNDAPKSKDMEQLIPRRVREIQQLKEAANLPKQKKSKQKSSIIQLAQQYGFQKKIGEDEEQLRKRMLRETNRAIDHDMFRARFGLAGRDISDLKKDYEELDEKARRKKALKILRAEKRAKLLAKNKIVEDIDEEDADSVDCDDPPEDEEEKSKTEGKGGKSNPDETKKKRLTKNERIRLLKKEEKEANDRELMLHAKEIIPFGERVDAPPEFKGKLKSIADPSAKAGSKDLLLKRVLESNNSTKNQTASSLPKKSKVSNEERQNVIKMYRELKKKKLQN